MVRALSSFLYNFFKLPLIGTCLYISNLQTVTFANFSMYPVIKEDEIGICRKIASYPEEYNALKVNDIVIVTSPEDPNKFICKRIKALGGEEVNYSDDSFLSQFGISSFVRDFVPKGHVWLEGDNSNHSLDSRNFGPIPIGLVSSVVKMKISLKEKNFELLH